MYSRTTAKRHTYEVVSKVIDLSKYPQAVVHHVDGNFRNYDKSNLVVCQDRSYHLLLHRRADAVRGTNYNNRFKYHECYLCHEYSHVKGLVRYTGTPFYFHLKCLVDKFKTEKEVVKEEQDALRTDISDSGRIS